MKIAFHTLGCKVNQYESEAMAALFRQRGHLVVDEHDFADVYVINTCTVTAEADRKSRQYIRRMKKVNPDIIVAVTGCYAQTRPEEVSAVAGVDIVTGTNEKSSLPRIVEEFAERGQQHVLRVHPLEQLTSYEDTGIVTSAENRTRAYVKIQEGCNRFCSYCVIPYARGEVRSRPMEDIIAEARKLIRGGYKEIVLTGINTALYGTEPGFGRGADGLCAGTGRAAAAEPSGIEPVIAALDDLDGDFRIRLSSLEPAVVNADYVKRLLPYRRLCHHLHLSAQSGSDAVLRAMNRPYDREQYLEIVRTLRREDPGYGISTDMIAGFPGEKEEDVEDSLDLIGQCGFCRTHVFRYSRRPMTAAAEMKDQIPSQVKGERSRRLQEAGEQAAEDFFLRCAGQTRRVLWETYSPEDGLLSGYTDSYIRVWTKAAPEEGESRLNTFEDVRLAEPFRDGMMAESSSP